MHISFWEKESFYNHKQVIIIGAGLAGLWSALELRKLDSTLNIFLLDKGVIPQGASTRNAGFACFGSPTELLHDAEIWGEDEMWGIVEMRYKGLEKIKAHFKADAIDFENCGGYELLDETFGYTPEALDEKLAWLNKGLEKITGEKQTYTRADDKINQFKFNSFKHIIENKLEGSLHSGKFVQALTKKVLSLGIEIISSVEVTGWAKQNDVIKVYTNNAPKLTCDKLLICNNGFAASLNKNINITPGRGQVIVTSPITNLPFKGTFHFDEGFYYFRNLGNRVLIGGARNKAFEQETSTDMEVTDVIQKELELFLQEKILSGQTYTIDYRWSGIMGFTETKLPMLKEAEPGVFALIACNGMGVALTPIMAEKAAALILNQ